MEIGGLLEPTFVALQMNGKTNKFVNYSFIFKLVLTHDLTVGLFYPIYKMFTCVTMSGRKVNFIIKKRDKRQQPTQCLNVYFLAIYFTL